MEQPKPNDSPDIADSDTARLKRPAWVEPVPPEDDDPTVVIAPLTDSE